MDMLLSEFANSSLQVVENHFRFLFEKHGFRVTALYDDYQRPYWFFILRSGDCLFKFEYDRGNPELKLARVPRGNPVPIELAEEWFDMLSVIEFARGMPRISPEEARIQGNKLASLEDDQLMAALSQMLEPVCSDVVSIFQRDSNLKTWAKLERYFQQAVP